MDQQYPFYTHVPKWIIDIVETKKCTKCGTKISKQSICAIGVRCVAADLSTVYVEHSCKCGYRSITSFSREESSSVEDLCYMLIEQIHNKRKIQKALDIRQQKDAGPIQDSEVKSFIKKMNTAKNFEEVLKYIGAPKIPPFKKPKPKQNESQ